jgi:hypothetical protein
LFTYAPAAQAVRSEPPYAPSNGTTTTVQSAYLATSGVLDVNALGTLGATFSGSILGVTFTHYNYDPTLGPTTPAADGCTTTVVFSSFSGTEAAPPARAPTASLHAPARLTHRYVD